jgi:hypothetical protein
MNPAKRKKDNWEKKRGEKSGFDFGDGFSHEDFHTA